jgi:hypothetical protein
VCTIVLLTFHGYIQVRIYFLVLDGLFTYIFETPLYLRLLVTLEQIHLDNVHMYHVHCWKRNGFRNKMALVSHVIDFVDVTIFRCRLFSVYSSIHIVVESACLFVGWLVLGSTVILLLFLISDRLRETR